MVLVSFPRLGPATPFIISLVCSTDRFPRKYRPPVILLLDRLGLVTGFVIGYLVLLVVAILLDLRGWLYLRWNFGQPAFFLSLSLSA